MLKGLIVGSLLHFMQIFVVVLAFLVGTIFKPFVGWEYAAMMTPFAIGLTQAFYMIPMLFYYKSQARPDVVKGLMVVAGITFLLNSSCFGVMWLGARR